MKTFGIEQRNHLDVKKIVTKMIADLRYSCTFIVNIYTHFYNYKFMKKNFGMFLTNYDYSLIKKGEIKSKNSSFLLFLWAFGLKINAKINWITIKFGISLN